MQPLHHDFRCPAAKNCDLTHAAVAPSNLDAAIQCDLQKSSCRTQNQCAQQRLKLQFQNRISTPEHETDDFEAGLKRNLKEKITSGKIGKSFDKSLSQDGVFTGKGNMLL